jgi:hypothetical protein
MLIMSLDANGNCHWTLMVILSLDANSNSVIGR